MQYRKLIINDKNKLIFGSAPRPVKTSRGLILGGGLVYPELNFTLPVMPINEDTFPKIKMQYEKIVTDAIERALKLHSNGVVFEFETLLEMTLKPALGIELVKIMNEVCEDYFQKFGFKSELRLTPNDLRDFERPPKMRTSGYLDLILELFEQGAACGGDLLSIESTGGKEIFDEAIMMCDIKQVIFALSVLGVRDMKFLWKKIVKIARDKGKIAGGDTACGFANTAMVLAENGYIPRIFSAIVRIASIVRSLIAIEEGATGPGKDCGYEGPFLKVIAGIPISMEGKTAACAHFSPLGNIAAACADLWSNESVQNIKLLGGMAPTVYLEQLEYDVRLFNAAISQGTTMAASLQKLLVESDAGKDPQALILSPESVLAIAKEIVKGSTYLEATINGILKALEILEEAILQKELMLEEREKIWLNNIREQVQEIPANENKFISELVPFLDNSKWIPAEYGL